jgi:hypothetical protein
MRIWKTLPFGASFFLVTVLMVAPVSASTCTGTLSGAVSCTGALNSPEDVFLYSFGVGAGGANVTIQTFGFGGGTNAAGQHITAGGFDPLIALFSGASTSATLLYDGSNPVFSDDNTTQFYPGCPPAGVVTIGSLAGQCGDDILNGISLGAGMYTLLLADANFVPLAVNPGPAGPYDLTDTSSNAYLSSTGNGAYNDLSSGVFQTCATFTDCNTDNGNFAVDIDGLPRVVTPEPSSLVVLCAGVIWVAGRRRRSERAKSSFQP